MGISSDNESYSLFSHIEKWLINFKIFYCYKNKIKIEYLMFHILLKILIYSTLNEGSSLFALTYALNSDRLLKNVL